MNDKHFNGSFERRIWKQSEDIVKNETSTPTSSHTRPMIEPTPAPSPSHTRPMTEPAPMPSPSHTRPMTEPAPAPTSPQTRPMVMDDTPEPLLWLIVERPLKDRGMILPIINNTIIGRRGSVRWGDKRMSREHARFLRIENADETSRAHFLIVPLQEHNGTMVNNRRIQQPTAIYENDVITMGETHFVVKVLY